MYIYIYIYIYIISGSQRWYLVFHFCYDWVFRELNSFHNVLIFFKYAFNFLTLTFTLFRKALWCSEALTVPSFSCLLRMFMNLFVDVISFTFCGKRFQSWTTVIEDWLTKNSCCSVFWIQRLRWKVLNYLLSNPVSILFASMRSTRTLFFSGEITCSLFNLISYWTSLRLTIIRIVIRCSISKYLKLSIWRDMQDELVLHKCCRGTKYLSVDYLKSAFQYSCTHIALAAYFIHCWVT